MSRPRLIHAAVGLVGSGLLVLLSAGPASAANQPTITITTSSASSVAGTASFAPDPLYGGSITDIKVVVSYNGHAVSSCDQCGANGNTTFNFRPSGLSYNGPYSAQASAQTFESLLQTGLGGINGSATATSTFPVAVPPAAPRVTTKVNSDGSVTVTWTRNSEPDLIGYQLQRRSSGSASLTTVAPFIAQPSSGSTLSFTDTGTLAGGDFGYIVTAFRNGSDGTKNTALATSSAAAAASVPVPPPPSTTTLAPGQVPVVAPAATTTTAPPPAPVSAPDLSAFLAQAAKAGVGTKAPAVHFPSIAAPRLSFPAQAGPPDTYDPTLPFGSPGARPQAPVTDAAPRIPIIGTPLTAGHQRSLVYSIAGGTLLCVLGLVVRSANRRRFGSDSLDSDDDPEGGQGSDGVAATPGVVSGTPVEVVPASVAAKAQARAAAAAKAQARAQQAAAANVQAKARVKADPVSADVQPQVGALADSGVDVQPQAGAKGDRVSVDVQPQVAPSAEWAPAGGRSAPATERPAPATKRLVDVAGAVPPAGSAGLDSSAARDATPDGSAGSACVGAPAHPSVDDRRDDPAGPTRPPRGRTLAGGSADRSPTVEEAVDYFRLLRSVAAPEPASSSVDADEVEVPAPTR